MSKNIHQVYIANPITSNASTDLMYFGQSPYTSGTNDAAMTYSSFSAQFALSSAVIDLAHGGTNANLTASNGGIFYSTATAGAILAGTATPNQVLLSGASTTPAWSTATYPATTTINQLLYSSSANVIAGLATANSATLYTTSAGVPAMTGSMTNGQLLIGSSGANPTLATLSAGTGTTITNAAGSITIGVTGGGKTWTVETTSANMVPDNGYITNSGSLITMTLPVTAAVGTMLSVNGLGAGGWKIAQNASQNIQLGDLATTTGTGGSLASTNQYDSINLVCLVANTTWATNGGPEGNITVV